MMKRPLLYVALGVVALLIIATGAWLFLMPKSEEPVAPQPSTTSAPVTNETIDQEVERLTVLAETDQFTEGNQVDTDVNLDNLGTTSPVYATLSVYTANKYVENAIANPYFVSGYWGTKDGYSVNAVKKYVTPYLTEELNIQYLEAATDPKAEAFTAFYNPKVFLPTPGLTIPEQCSEDWVKEVCYTMTPPPTISNVVITGLDENSVKLDATVTINPIYWNPAKSDGDLMIQPRVYTLSMALDEVNPANNDGKPIMLVKEITSTLDIKDNIEYITNVGD